jgi:CHAT domain-containing protein/tetratricopeptide (TPR) repeat protein
MYWVLCVALLASAFSYPAATLAAEADPVARVLLLQQEIDKLAAEGKYAEAIPKAREVLQLSEKALGPTHAALAPMLDNLAVLVLRSGDQAAAISLLERSLRLREDSLGLTHPDLVPVLMLLALALRDTGSSAAAPPLLERALRIQEQVGGPTDPRLVTTLIALADLLRLGGDSAAARPLYERALMIQEHALGPTHPDVAVTLRTIALFLLAAGDYTAARPLMERALPIMENSLGPTHPSVATMLNDLGLLLQSIGDYAAARIALERALEIREQTLGPTHLDTAESLGAFGALLVGMGDFATAKASLERALAIKEQTLGPTHLDVAWSLTTLGILLNMTRDFMAAKPLFERAVAIQEHILGSTHPNLAICLTGLASIFHTQGDDEEARVLYERAIKIVEQGSPQENSTLAMALSGLATLLRDTGDYSGAKAILERVLAIQENALGSGHPGVAGAMSNLAGILVADGEYDRAKTLLEQAQAIQERVFGPAHPAVAESITYLADIRQATGDHAAAKPLYERALTIREKVFGPVHLDVAAGLSRLGLLLMLIGDKTGAKPLLQRSLAIQESILGPNHSKVAQTLNQLAFVEEDRLVARSLLERALSLQERNLNPTHPDVAETLGNLALFLRSIGDPSGAEPLLERALTIREKTLGTNHPWVAFTLFQLARLRMAGEDYPGATILYKKALAIFSVAFGSNSLHAALCNADLAALEWKMDRSAQAIQKLDESVTIIRAYLMRGLVGLGSRQKLLFMFTLAGLFDALLALPSELVPKAMAYQAVLDWKNLHFRTLAAERTLIEANPAPRTVALLHDYTAIRRRVAAVSFLTSEDVAQDRTQSESLMRRLEALEEELSRTSATFRQSRAEASVTPGDVCAAIPAGAAFLDLLRYGRPDAVTKQVQPHYIAFVITGHECREPIRIELGHAAPIDEDVRRFRETLSHDGGDLATRDLRSQYRKHVATRLAEKLFPSPLRAVLAGKSRLIIAPDGALALLPFALLPGDHGHEFLMETRTISYVPSGRDLLRKGAPAPAAMPLLAVGAPAFNWAPIQVAQVAVVRAGCAVQEESFASLPGTAQELNAISNAARQARPTQSVTVLDGAQATKAAFLEKAPTARVLHLATHAYFAGEECAPVALPALLGQNPLLLAGIAFAGANEREKVDGILTALEVTALDLRASDLVVLSACDTGLGTLTRGQELLGLRWAFAYAGAKHLVTSLWTVPDHETATLMGHFYTALWKNSLPVADALRAAQLAMLQSAREKGDPAPHAWGAFVASGTLE